MADPKIAGVRAFGDLGTHKLDILMWLFGGIESVTADIRPVTHRYGDCDETGEALIRFQSGVIGTLAAGWVDIEDPVKLLISGTQGHAVIFNDQLFYRSEKVSGSDSTPALDGFASRRHRNRWINFWMPSREPKMNPWCRRAKRRHG